MKVWLSLGEERLRTSHLLGLLLLSTSAATNALAQELPTMAAQPLTEFQPSWGKVVEPAVPDHGFVLYDQAGKPIKAFGPNTPVFTDNGQVQIPGVKIPEGGVLQTEDAPAYFNALANIAKDAPDQPDSDYTKSIRQVVDAIGNGAAYVQANLCKHPARPSKIQVELVGGFSFGVYGSIKSTVDWDLEKVCVDANAQ